MRWISSTNSITVNIGLQNHWVDGIPTETFHSILNSSIDVGFLKTKCLTFFNGHCVVIHNCMRTLQNSIGTVFITIFCKICQLFESNSCEFLVDISWKLFNSKFNYCESNKAGWSFISYLDKEQSPKIRESRFEKETFWQSFWYWEILWPYITINSNNILHICFQIKNMHFYC